MENHSRNQNSCTLFGAHYVAFSISGMLNKKPGPHTSKKNFPKNKHKKPQQNLKGTETIIES